MLFQEEYKYCYTVMKDIWRVMDRSLFPDHKISYEDKWENWRVPIELPSKRSKSGQTENSDNQGNSYMFDSGTSKEPNDKNNNSSHVQGRSLNTSQEYSTKAKAGTLGPIHSFTNTGYENDTYA